MKATFLTLFAAAAFTLALTAAGEMYRWVDENGRIHYSDQPPPATLKQQKEMKQRVRPSSGATTAEPAPNYVDQEAAFRKRQVEQAEKQADEQKAQQAAAEKQQNCQRTRQHLATLQSGTRITRANAQGEREYLDDAQIAQEIQAAQQAAAQWCN
jgi:hypothetical protein